MRFRQFFLACLFTSAVQAQFIIGAIFAIEVVFEIVSTVTEAVVWTVSSVAEIAMAEGTGAAAGELTFEATNVEASATTAFGETGDTMLTQSESAGLFSLEETGFSQLPSGTKMLTKEFKWGPMNIQEARSPRSWAPDITATISTPFKQEGRGYVTEGISLITKQKGNPNTSVFYGSNQPAGGYKMNIQTLRVKPRVASS